MMESIEEGEKVLVSCYVLEVNRFDDTCMIQVESEDTRAILKVKSEDIYPFIDKRGLYEESVGDYVKHYGYVVDNIVYVDDTVSIHKDK